ncbi:MAG: 30S ribosome-binding factor RbfA [Actinomycetes bacterium]|jgi:ribosome-binding factor A
MSQARVRRVADRIKETVALLLDTRVKDPRLGFVTITEVRITGDLREATVFYTVLGDDENRASTKAALESAKGMLRSEVGKALGIRHTPSLEFLLDGIPENAIHISEVLRTAQERDQELQKIAQSGKYAAGEDPYRHKERDESNQASS